MTDNDGLTGSASVTVVATGPPAAPSSLAAGDACNGSDPNHAAIGLNWQDNSNNETLFRIQWYYGGDVTAFFSGQGKC